MSNIIDIDVLNESKQEFLTYSGEVLTDRAIPSAEDGLLSSQRKILWTMKEYLKMNNKSKTKKCNSIIGSTLLTSYIHGDQACYGVLVKMAQQYLMRYPLIEGQGSLGTQESNDMVASSRYTEAKPSIYSDLMMEDYEKNIVDKKPTYNDEFLEPIVLPSIFPNALVNGKEAIGVSMAHNSLPNNLKEVCEGIIAFIQKEGNISIEELMMYIKGPDFPLGNVVINSKDIKEAYATGQSAVSLKVRGDYEIKDNKIIFNTIPYRTYRNKIKEQINKNIDELEKYFVDFRDESNLGKNKLIFEVGKGVNIDIALAKLFALTDLQTTLSYNMNYIVDGTPKLCSLIDLIQAYVNHQNNIIIRTAQYDKDKARARKHILEGLLIAIGDIDKAIELIRSSQDKIEAQNKLISYFEIDEIQAKAILDMKLSKLTKLDKEELEKELKEKIAIIDKSNKLINDKVFRNNFLIEKIKHIEDTFGDERRTKLENIKEIKFTKAKPEPILEKCIISFSNQNKICRYSTKAKETTDNRIKYIFDSDNQDILIIFTSVGKCYKVYTKDIVINNMLINGINIYSLAKIPTSEQIIYITTNKTIYKEKYLMFITQNGLLRKSLIEDFVGIDNLKAGCAQAIKLKENDKVVKIVPMNNEKLVLISSNGQGFAMQTNLINPLGKASYGVIGMSLSEDDKIVNGFLYNSNSQFVMITKNGYSKKLPMSCLPELNRGAKGNKIYKKTKTNENIIFVSEVTDNNKIQIYSDKTNTILPCKLMAEDKTNTVGKKIINHIIKDILII